MVNNASEEFTASICNVKDRRWCLAKKLCNSTLSKTINFDTGRCEGLILDMNLLKYEERMLYSSGIQPGVRVPSGINENILLCV
jgi:hypothetical protein